MATRRQALQTGAAAATLAAFPGLWGNHGFFNAATAETLRQKRLIVVNLRGGVDGLSLVPVPGDPDFSDVRRQLEDGRSDDGIAALPLDGFYALHPKLTALPALWRDKDLAIVHAVHTVSRNRSHFDAQDFLELGLNRLSSRAGGWLNRALGFYGQPPQPLGLAVGYGMPLILTGPQAVTNWAPRYLPEADDEFLKQLIAASGSDPTFANALSAGAAAAKRNTALLGDDAVRKPGSTRSAGAIAQLARATGKMLAVEDGATVATFDIGGWDTHGYQNIAHSYRMAVLNDALAALQRTLGAAWQHTVILVVTEFGRTVHPNGTNGTDHGTAGAALVLGGAVNGGRAIADWPGLSHADLYDQRDLLPTIDMRALFKAVLLDHLQMDAQFIEDTVFPDSRNVKPIADLINV